MTFNRKRVHKASGLENVTSPLGYLNWYVLMYVLYKKYIGLFVYTGTFTSLLVYVFIYLIKHTLYIL